jgi:altronate dehydratase small subunit
MNSTALKIWVIDKTDNVGTVIGGNIDSMTSVAIVGATLGTLDVVPAVPYGHKVALHAMPVGTRVVKYGVVIGRLVGDVEQGEHVHVHNLQSLRGRGDLEA